MSDKVDKLEARFLSVLELQNTRNHELELLLEKLVGEVVKLKEAADEAGFEILMLRSLLIQIAKASGIPKKEFMAMLSLAAEGMGFDAEGIARAHANAIIDKMREQS